VPALNHSNANWSPKFPAGEIVSLPYELKVPLFGGYLQVPPYTHAAITHPTGQIDVFPNGTFYLDYLSRPGYIVQLVDTSQHTTSIGPIQGQSSDAWGIVLNIEVIWQVIRPRQVLGIRNFMRTLTAAFRAVIMDYLRTIPLERIIQIPGDQSVIPDEQIGREICKELRKRVITRGVVILDVILTERQGDQRCIDVIQNAIVQTKTINTELQVQALKTKLTATQYKQEQELLDAHRKIELAQAETARLVAEEMDRQRLRKAENDAEEARLRQPVRELEIEYQQKANDQQLQYQKEMKLMDVKGEVVKNGVQALLNSLSMAGLAGGLDDTQLKEMQRMVESLIYSLNPDLTQLISSNAQPDLLEIVNRDANRVTEEMTSFRLENVQR